MPAYNEGETVGAIVGACLAASGVGDVLVVDDCSRDETAERARAAGAYVVSHGANLGKGSAMRTGLEHVDSDPVLFIDADLGGLRPEHVDRMIGFAEQFDMVIGFNDYGIFNAVQALGPVISGQRVVRRFILAAVPEFAFDGFRVETGINHAAERTGALVVGILNRGVRQKSRLRKVGVVRGAWDLSKMAADICKTQIALARTSP